VTVEVLYFEGCPNHEPAVERVREVLGAEAILDEVKEIEVRDSDMATRLRFLGSPTVRVNGIDIDPSAFESESFGLMCRTCPDGCCQSGVPSAELIRQAILGEK
jgi:hypothetical protein